MQENFKGDELSDLPALETVESDNPAAIYIPIYILPSLVYPLTYSHRILCAFLTVCVVYFDCSWFAAEGVKRFHLKLLLRHLNRIVSEIVVFRVLIECLRPLVGEGRRCLIAYSYVFIIALGFRSISQLNIELTIYIHFHWEPFDVNTDSAASFIYWLRKPYYFVSDKETL